MTVPLRANVAHVVAKLVARRATSTDELPMLMRVVHHALEQLAQPQPAAAPEPEPVHRAPRAARVVRPRRAVLAAELELPSSEPPPPPQPRLLRRADVVASPAPEVTLAPRPMPSGVLRGVVKWFDQRLRRGALRLPGCGGDVPVEPALLAEMGVSRLYKGQEVEATLSAETTPRVVRLTIPGGVWQVHQSAGVVHNRHAKPVVVELKRETMRRAAARAEAEILLGGPSRAR
jgi:hypothetical protein